MDAGSSRNEHKAGVWPAALAISACILLPLAGALLDGQPLARYLEFPPLTRYVHHAPFYWPVFAAGLAVAAAVVLFLIFLFRHPHGEALSRNLRHRMPWWGWSGALLSMLTWICAWNRFSWLQSLQAYTFTPLWIGYILAVSGLVTVRTGTCLALRQPVRFLLLFPASALFWWYFEYLNRFVQNWYYLGIENFSALAYVVHASVCFSTVLPAVTVTTELLDTLARLHGPLRRNRCIGLRLSHCSGVVLLVASLAGLAGIAVFPDLLFPLVWMAPLLVMVALKLLAGRETLLASLRYGDWRPIILPALAALVCGFFWEMWNWKSLAHWEYSIPWVDRFHVFAMPVLGYLGYLPFGLECHAIVEMILHGAVSPGTTARHHGSIF